MIGDVSWQNQLDDVIFGHGISLLRWRSGGVKNPHDMPLSDSLRHQLSAIAQRYSNTVDVAAVRELYGTVLNEGANRGILVTTSHFGRDAHEWAAKKPLTLIDGPNLLALLTKHGYNFKIEPAA
ncbi:restriction endonuclease [Bradyrhizobium sp. ISRA442]|uniref:restriction endonuclease n=1 Tax=Bradyrhizobium sp. ISRA442 TaxID=2866197 RepID=UPI00311B0791